MFKKQLHKHATDEAPAIAFNITQEFEVTPSEAISSTSHGKCHLAEKLSAIMIQPLTASQSNQRIVPAYNMNNWPTGQNGQLTGASRPRTSPTTLACASQDPPPAAQPHSPVLMGQPTGAARPSASPRTPTPDGGSQQRQQSVVELKPVRTPTSTERLRVSRIREVMEDGASLGEAAQITELLLEAQPRPPVIVLSSECGVTECIKFLEVGRTTAAHGSAYQAHMQANSKRVFKLPESSSSELIENKIP